MEAYKSGAKIVILDDGFQNPSVYKDFSILVIDTDFDHGKSYIFPLGLLRESLEFALKRTDLLLCLGKYESRKSFSKKTKIPSYISFAEGQLNPKTYPTLLKKKKLIAFCGIARPEKFFSDIGKAQFKRN